MTDQDTPIVRLERPDHNLSRSLVDSDALWILRKLRSEGHMAYLVGGAVRDILLGRAPKDFDIGTDARPSELKRIFRNIRLIGRRFRLAHVYFRRRGEPEKVIEVSSFRGLAKRGAEGDIPPEDLDLTGNVFGTPEEDARRRDFTVNALFYDIADFSIIDYTGGLADLDRRIIRLIGDPDERFAEDTVRMLRAVEFAVRLDFTIEPATEAGIRRNAARIVEASPARLREEIRQMEQRGIMADVLRAALGLGLFAPLFPNLTETEGMHRLLKALDERTVSGDPQPEHVYIAALCLPTVAARCPLVGETRLEEAAAAIFDVVGEVCGHYQISAHIRHLAREVLLSCYRLAKGKRYRTKGRFMKKPEFAAAWEFILAWDEVKGGLTEVVGYWRSYLAQREEPARKGGGGAGRRRRPRRRGGRKPRHGGGGVRTSCRVSLPASPFAEILRHRLRLVARRTTCTVVAPALADSLYFAKMRVEWGGQRPRNRSRNSRVPSVLL